MIRQIFLTDKYEDIPALTKLQNLAEDMGNSVKQSLEYIKR